MYLIVIGWIYVALMMAIAEATATNGTIVGALVTFVLYGVGPVSLVVYLLNTPTRRKRIRERDAAELASRAAVGSGEPDAGSETPADAITPMRKKS